MSRSRMQNILVVSDIHGFPETVDELFDVGLAKQCYLQLADLCGRPDLRGEDLHDNLFHAEGMRNSIRTLREIGETMCVGIGFSAGGTVLWNAVKEGLKLQALICISSTRLRFETVPLNIPALVIWGECDPYRPEEEWNKRVPMFWKTYPGKQHDFYRKDVHESQSLLRLDLSDFMNSDFLPAIQAQTGIG